MQNNTIPPHDTDIEKAVLGTLINFPDMIYDISDTIGPDTFYNPAHVGLYKIMVMLMQKDMTCDLSTVNNELANNPINGIDLIYLANLTDLGYVKTYLDQHCLILKQLKIKRDLVITSRQIQIMAFDPMSEVSELIDYSQKAIFENTVDEIRSEPEHIGNITTKAIDEIEYKVNNPDKKGIPSGFKNITWHNSDLNIIAARPAMGKTFLGVVKFAMESAMYGVPTLIFSLEMSKVQITQRFMSLEQESNSNDLRNGKNIDWSKIEQSQTYFSNLPVFIDDNAGLTVWQIVSKARKMHIRHNIGLIIIDYIGLVSGISKNVGTRDQELGVISRTLKKLAKDLNVPVLALSQLNRGVEQRQDKRPLLSDLRESGNIEQDADAVYMLFRPFYYTENNEDLGKGEIICRKNRHGELGVTNFYHTSDWSKISSNDTYLDEDLFKEAKQETNSDIKQNDKFEDDPF